MKWNHRARSMAGSVGLKSDELHNIVIRYMNLNVSKLSNLLETLQNDNLTEAQKIVVAYSLGRVMSLGEAAKFLSEVQKDMEMERRKSEGIYS
jgi:hypothetical protein